MNSQIRGAGMRRVVLAVMLACGAGVASAMSVAPDEAVLLRAYFRQSLARQISTCMADLARGLPEADAIQVKAAAAEWVAGRKGTIRQDLDARFPGGAQARFKSFLDEFTTAEQSSDSAFLQQLVGKLNLAEPRPTDYAALRQTLMSAWLRRDMEQGSKLLGETETWATLKKDHPDVPDLKSWLSRGEGAGGAQGTSPRVSAPKKPPADSLADAEVPFEKYDAPSDEASSSLDSLTSVQKKRREKELEEAHAGMEQVASERQKAEEEYGEKQMRAAKAEAEAVKRQAERLAGTEKEALAQRQNSWEQRIKNILGATVKSATGAFTSKVGTRAGEELADDLFEDDE